MEHPGLLFVAATLLPLASFLLLFLAGGARWALRPFGFFSEYKPSPIGAYVATGAMALAFLCSATGFVLHYQDVQAHQHEAEHPPQVKEGEHKHDHAGHSLEDHWSGSWEFARLSFWDDKVGEPTRPATVLAVGYYIDTLAATMFAMVTLIATLIHLFSIGYMSDELQPIVEDHQVHTAEGHLHRRGRFGRFFMFLSLFCFSMLNLVLADNLFQVFVSWELVGICSYLLIGFYYERTSASNAAIKAFVTNRVGDAGFIIGLLIIWTHLGTFDFQEIFHHVRAPIVDSHQRPIVSAGQVIRANWIADTKAGKTFEISQDDGSYVILLPDTRREDAHLHGEDIAPLTKDRKDPAKQTKTRITGVKDHPGEDEFGSMPYWLLIAAGLGIFLGCVGKSAQFPLHVWLPDAMEGPTPVSALIHAATMVAAGVYLVGRCYPLFVPESRLVIAYTGAITLFVAATIAIVATDIKKVLAYSTVSQLGYMMLALGVGGWIAGLFHLITHAFFKALLFLGSGSVIHGCHHEQDMTKMGGLYPKMKITAVTMLIGVLTIAGIPFFSGWYSKDSILAHAIGFAMVHREHFLLFLLPLATAGITTFYMFRMWFMTFAGAPKDHHVYEHAHESPATMTIPLIVLAFFSVVVAWGWPIWDVEASALEGHVHHSQHHSILAEFGVNWDHPHESTIWKPIGISKNAAESERFYARQYGHLAGNLALGVVLLGIIFASLLYYYRRLDPDDAKEQFPGLHRFLWNKWYFDELYSAVLVRPALTVAHWCKTFDLKVIDGTVHFLARLGVQTSKLGGRIDLRIVDGLVNLVADVTFSIGAWLKNVQTGYIRSYVLFLVLAVIGIYFVLSYFVTLATAG